MKTISQILILAMLHLCWLTSYGYAEMIPTESAVQSQNDRQRLLDLLDRQEVIEELEKYDITKVEAVTRINSLTDEEVTQIAGKLDELPPGGFYEAFIIPILVAGGILVLLFASTVCIFSKNPYGECVSKYMSNYSRALKGGKGGRGPDPQAGFEYCKTDCQSDLEDCMESADGDKIEEQKCEVDKNKCVKKCTDWAEGFQGGLSDIQACHIDCNKSQKICVFDSINEGEDTLTANTQCNKEKNTCFQQCKSNEDE